MQELENNSSLLDAIIGLGEHRDSDSYVAEHMSEFTVHHPLEVLDDLLAIKSQFNLVHENIKDKLDKNQMAQFIKLDKELSKITTRLIKLKTYK